MVAVKNPAPNFWFILVYLPLRERMNTTEEYMIILKLTQRTRETRQYDLIL